MKFSERWLRSLVDPPLDSAALCDRLTMGGLEVEASEPAAPPFSGVVVGHIDSIAPHPNADRLRVCKVAVGQGAPLQIVCGAPNAAAGMKAPCALVGAVLPGGLAIRKTTMRGVESAGMLCSATELGIDDDASGLLALSSDTAVGTDLRSALALDDRLITLKLTPNRADCLSLLGIAREVAALTEAPLQPPAVTAATVSSDLQRTVRVEDPAACPRFASRVIEGIDARAPTPAWMKERLARSGIRSISAVVDVTNYVMLELGQPLHAYDDDRLEGALVVRFARPGEKLSLLNGQTLALEADLLLVCDEQKPLGLAGIMGGEYSGISGATTNVLLEAAFWTPAVIQGKSRRLGFVSDAGYRFERGVDFGGCARAIEHASELILAICGGSAGPLGDVLGPLPARDPIRLRAPRVARLLGIELPAADIASIFNRLQLNYRHNDEEFFVTPPSYRFDLAIEEDLVEEIARLYGYTALPVTPRPHVQRMLPDPEARRSVHDLKRRLVARDWQEAITFSFVHSAAEAACFPDRDDASKPIAVLNPIASQLDVMRTSLWPGLLEVLRNNLARKQERVRIFEAGRCFLRKANGYAQPLRIAGIAYGDALSEQWGERARQIDLFDVKADMETLAAPRRIGTRAMPHPALHPGRSASVILDGQAIGWLGELHPRLARYFELPKAPILYELEIEPLLQQPLPQAKPVSKLPIVRRDLAIVVDESIPAEEILAALEAAKPPQVEAMQLFDLYRGPGIGVGKKSLAILVLMQDTERTLTDAEIDAVVADLLRLIEDRFGATLRR